MMLKKHSFSTAPLIPSPLLAGNRLGLILLLAVLE